VRPAGTLLDQDGEHFYRLGIQTDYEEQKVFEVNHPKTMKKSLKIKIFTLKK